MPPSFTFPPGPPSSSGGSGISGPAGWTSGLPGRGTARRSLRPGDTHSFKNGLYMDTMGFSSGKRHRSRGISPGRRSREQASQRPGGPVVLRGALFRGPFDTGRPAALLNGKRRAFFAVRPGPPARRAHPPPGEGPCFPRDPRARRPGLRRPPAAHTSAVLRFPPSLRRSHTRRPSRAVPPPPRSGTARAKLVVKYN